MARELPHASLLEGVRFTLQVMLPQVVQGLFRRRPRAVAAATKLDVDRRAVAAIGGIRHSHGKGPVWVRVGAQQMLLVLSTSDVQRVLEGSPDPFAADPDAKRRGMSHFQPDALTISRGKLWENRRRFTEYVLDTGKPVHRLGGRFAGVAAEEAARLLGESERENGGELGWEGFHRAFGRITRRVVLGDRARDDEEVTALLATLMEEANRLPGGGSDSLPVFQDKVRQYVQAAEEGSLAGLAAEAPSDEQTRVERQLTHWLFAMGDTLPANAFRALALIATHTRQRAGVEAELERASGGEGLDADGVASLAYLEACLHEAMRLWPTTPILSRGTLEQTDWDGAVVPAGTQVVICNTFNHRDPERHEFASRFSPEAWIEGEAANDWSFNHFSRGPQGCPGADLALFLGKAALANLLLARRFHLLQPRLDPSRPLPHMLDFFSLRFTVEQLPARNKQR
jgi:cytochrome P450